MMFDSITHLSNMNGQNREIEEQRMAAAPKYSIMLDVVGLEHEHLGSGLLPNIEKIAEMGESARLEPVFPAVTCTVQARMAAAASQPYSFGKTRCTPTLTSLSPRDQYTLTKEW
jgi:hypothetical protein